jgi:hypothetical protein
MQQFLIKGLRAELNPIWHLLALLGAQHILHVSRIRVKHQLATGQEDIMVTNIVSP